MWERERERKRDWIDDGVPGRQTVKLPGRRDGGGWEVYCSVTFPVSAGGSVHQDIKYATMLTEPVS